MSQSRFISADEYINKYLEAYELGKGFHWISQELGTSYRRAISKAGYYRSYGIELPYLNNYGRNLNDESREELNGVIRSKLREMEKKPK